MRIKHNFFFCSFHFFFFVVSSLNSCQKLFSCFTHKKKFIPVSSIENTYVPYSTILLPSDLNPRGQHPIDDVEIESGRDARTKKYCMEKFHHIYNSFVSAFFFLFGWGKCILIGFRVYLLLYECSGEWRILQLRRKHRIVCSVSVCKAYDLIFVQGYVCE